MTIYTLTEAAEASGEHQERLRRAARKGLLRAVRVGREWRVTAAELETWRGLLAPPQAAQLLRSTPEAIIAAIHSGKLDARKHAMRYYIEREQLAAWWRAEGGGELDAGELGA
jgi:excisionase family DNA binding protein